MTKDEAAKMIKDDMRLHHDYLSGTYRKALNMAIDALETEAIPVKKIRDLYNCAIEYRDRFKPFSEKWLVANDQAIGIRTVLELC